jgi:anti-sigma B factor antagonist
MRTLTNAICYVNASFVSPEKRKLMDINVQSHPQNRVHVIQLRGDLKLGDPTEKLRRTLDGLLENGDVRFVLQMAEVPMVDSSGIGILVRFLTSVKRREGAIKLVSPSKFTTQTLKIVGVLNLFEVYDDQDQAVQSFG